MLALAAVGADSSVPLQASTTNSARAAAPTVIRLLIEFNIDLESLTRDRFLMP